MGVEETVDDGVHVGGGVRVRLRSSGSLGRLRPVAQVKCLGDGILQVAEITLFNIESTSKSGI